MQWFEKAKLILTVCSLSRSALRSLTCSHFPPTAATFFLKQDLEKRHPDNHVEANLLGKKRISLLRCEIENKHSSPRIGINVMLIHYKASCIRWSRSVWLGVAQNDFKLRDFHNTEWKLQSQQHDSTGATPHMQWIKYLQRICIEIKGVATLAFNGAFMTRPKWVHEQVAAFWSYSDRMCVTVCAFPVCFRPSLL